MSRSTMALQRSAIAVALVTLLLSLAPLAAFAAAPDIPRDPLEHRRAEAEAKSQAFDDLAAAKWEFLGNQADYDATYYRVEVDVRPNLPYLYGTATMHATVVTDSIDVLDLDFDEWSMIVDSATSGGLPATFIAYPIPLIRVNLDRTYYMGETVEVSVTYQGEPSPSGMRFDYIDGQRHVYTDCQPYDAHEWYPCKDHPGDKADSCDVFIEVPGTMTAVSNGLLISVVPNGSRNIYHWQHRHPITTYNISIACYAYDFFNDWYTPQAGGDPMEIVNYVFPSQADTVRDNLLLAAPVMSFFAQLWGEYPYLDEKYGHAMFTRGGGMEHQTITSMGGWSEDLVVHELAHSWFGNHVTCDGFEHIWIHEGVASWAEAYWREFNEGPAAYRSHMQSGIYYGEGTVFVEDPDYGSNIFDYGLTYNKASWVVHMMRWILGDTDFNAGLYQFITTYAEGNATTEDFQAVMESVSGKDLDHFFQRWIYEENFPIYDFSWNQNASTVEVIVQQVQTNAGLFDLPLEIQVNTDIGSEIHLVQNSLASENYSFPVTGTVESVVLDPNSWILKQVKIPTSNPLFTKGILLVNGVDLDWENYVDDIFSAYEDSVFWGSHDIDFWDCFPESPLGYPANLPPPIGHGQVPSEIIGNYSTVIWIGNNYNGDLGPWLASPIKEYLAVGGNVLLMSRNGVSFIDDELTNYLGITWMEPAGYNEIGDCTAVYPGLVDVPFTGEQFWIDVFDTVVGPNSTLLTKDMTGFTGERGLGVHAQPPGGGSHRSTGGQFVYLAGRPYRMDHDALRSNVVFILNHFFGEPWDMSDIPDSEEVVCTRSRLLPSYPNPFNPQTVIPLEIPRAGAVELSVYDVMGRLVRMLAAQELPAGRHEFSWDGLDGAGRAVASGTYFAQLRSGAVRDVKPLTLVR